MRVALIGYGKMGHEIERVLIAKGHNVAIVIDRDNADDFNADRMKCVDVAIEFSTPSSAFDNVIKCLDYGVPVVCGTTAWVERLNEVKEHCVKRDGAFFYASNYSIGMNLMFRVNEELARMMNRFPSYDVTIEEVHHTAKLDAPSGTAVTLAEGILGNIARKKRWVLGASTVPDELNVAALRRSVVPGTHCVIWDSEVDEITITHRAKSRTGLAEGAVIAAEFLIGKKGFYDMDDLLNY